MGLVQWFADGVGDVIGTSGYSKANKVFNALLGTDMKRQEYNKAKRLSNDFADVSNDQADALIYEINKLGKREHLEMANAFLTNMADSGTHFSTNRTVELTQSVRKIVRCAKEEEPLFDFIRKQPKIMAEMNEREERARRRGPRFVVHRI